MNKIEILLKELCPNGVEWKEVGDVTQIKKGKQLNKSLLTDDGTYPAYNGGQFESGRTDRYNVDENTTIISQGGASAGFVNFITTKFWANAHCYFLLPDKKIINNKYLYHFIKMKQNNLMESQYGSGIPALKVDSISKIKIPIPPFEIQEEIVKILDKFTDYVTELTTELTLRQKQYNYYRDKLLTFEGEEVVWKTLNEISTNMDNLRRPVTKTLRNDGIYPYYGASGIVDYVGGYIFEGNFLLVSEDGANLKVRNTPIAFSISGKNWVNNHAHVLKFNNLVTQKFVEYYLNSIDLSNYISGAAQPKLNQKNLNMIKIPHPTLEKQEQIVSVLNTFEKLCNDIINGLPKEIELRQKQYEYYRDKLLSFD